MHAFDLLVKLNAPFQGVEFDQRSVVWRLFTAVVEQINEPDEHRAVARNHADWVPANFNALRLVVDYYGIHYDDLSLLDLMPAFEQVILMQYVIDYFIEMVDEKEGRVQLSETNTMVKKLVPLTMSQIELEVVRYMKAKEDGKGYEVSEVAKVVLRNEKWKVKTAKWGAVGKLVRKAVMVKA
ncbi:hypothetical protein FRC07_007435 [Ceratobasidium sp. 392]|nr:hypothetical protein FRC07_007435 [Ceratobasidium sp. 392]